MDAITQISYYSLQPDAQVWYSKALNASVAIRQASSREEKQQLTLAMAREAREAPAEMAKVFTEKCASICDMKDRFECSGRQPSKQEGDRNEAALGYRTPTAFLNAVASEMGASTRTLRRCLDATYYYRWELTLPQGKRMNPATEAACIMWDMMQDVEPEKRLSIMDIAQGEASANKDGKLT